MILMPLLFELMIDKSRWKKENRVDINYKFTSKNFGISSLVFELVVAQFVKANKNFNNKYEIGK